MSPQISKWLLVESHCFRCCLPTPHAKNTHFLPKWDCLCLYQYAVSFLKACHILKSFFLLKFFFFFSLGMSHTLFCFVLLIITGNVKHTQIEVHNEPP